MQPHPLLRSGYPGPSEQLYSDGVGQDARPTEMYLGIPPRKAPAQVRELLLRDPVRRVSAKVPKKDARNKQVAPRSGKELIWLFVAGCV